MQNQCQGDNAVGDEHAEVFADARVAEQGVACGGSNDEQGVEQDAAQDSLCVGCTHDGCAADQNGRAGVQADLLVCAVGLIAYAIS